MFTKCKIKELTFESGIFEEQLNVELAYLKYIQIRKWLSIYQLVKGTCYFSLICNYMYFIT